jgi:hypothetical protein
VFESVRNPGHALTERAVNYIVKAAASRAGVNPAASVHWLRHAHASHAIDTAERGTYFATYRGSFVGPEPARDNDAGALAA